MRLLSKSFVILFLLVFSSAGFSASSAVNDSEDPLSVEDILGLVQGGGQGLDDVIKSLQAISSKDKRGIKRVSEDLDYESSSSSGSSSSSEPSSSSELSSSSESDSRKKRHKTSKSSTTKWICPQCTYSNSKAVSCEVCHYKKKRKKNPIEEFVAVPASSHISTATERAAKRMKTENPSSQQDEPERPQEVEGQKRRLTRSSMDNISVQQKLQLVNQAILEVRDVNKNVGRGLFNNGDKPIKKGEALAHYSGEYLSLGKAKEKYHENAEEISYYFDIPVPDSSVAEAVINGWSENLSKNSKGEYNKTVDEINSDESFKKAGAGEIGYLGKCPSLASYINHRDWFEDDMFKYLRRKKHTKTEDKLEKLTELLESKGFLKSVEIEPRPKKYVKVKYIQAKESQLLSLDLSTITSSRESQIIILTNLFMMNGINATFCIDEIDKGVEIKGVSKEGSKYKKKPKKSYKVVKVKAIRDILPGEEICLSYEDSIYRNKIWEFSGNQIRKEIATSSKFSEKLSAETFLQDIKELHNFSYISSEGKKVNKKLPYDALVVVYFGMLYQENQSFSSEDISTVLKGKYFDPSFDLGKDIDLCVEKSSCSDFCKERLKSIFTMFKKREDVDSIMDEAINIFVENFDFFRPYFDASNTSKNCNYYNKERTNHGTILSDILLLIFSDRNSPDEFLKWSLSEKYTKSLIKKIREVKNKEFTNWLYGMDGIIEINQFTRYGIAPSFSKAQSLQESLINKGILDYDYTFEFERDFSDRDIISGIRKSLENIEIDPTETKINQVLKIIYQDKIEEEGDKLKLSLESNGVLSKINKGNHFSSFIVLTKRIEECLNEAKIDSTPKNIELVLRILFFNGYRVDFVSGDSIIGSLEKCNLHHLSEILISELLVEQKQELFLFRNIISGDSPIHYILEWGRGSGEEYENLFKILTECCGSLDLTKDMDNHDGYPFIFSAARHCPYYFKQLLEINKECALLLGPNNSNLLHAMRSFSLSSRDSKEQRLAINMMVESFRCSMSSAQFYNFTDPDGINSKTKEGQSVFDLIADVVTQDSLKFHFGFDEETLSEEEQSFFESVFNCLVEEEVIVYSPVRKVYLVESFNKDILYSKVTKILQITEGTGSFKGKAGEYCDCILDFLWDAHCDLILRSLLDREYFLCKNECYENLSEKKMQELFYVISNSDFSSRDSSLEGKLELNKKLIKNYRELISSEDFLNYISSDDYSNGNTVFDCIEDNFSLDCLSKYLGEDCMKFSAKILEVLIKEGVIVNNQFKERGGYFVPLFDKDIFYKKLYATLKKELHIEDSSLEFVCKSVVESLRNAHDKFKIRELMSIEFFIAKSEVVPSEDLTTIYNGTNRWKDYLNDLTTKNYDRSLMFNPDINTVHQQILREFLEKMQSKIGPNSYPSGLVEPDSAFEAGSSAAAEDSSSSAKEDSEDTFNEIPVATPERKGSTGSVEEVPLLNLQMGFDPFVSREQQKNQRDLSLLADRL
jgi:hypothetical protein